MPAATTTQVLGATLPLWCCACGAEVQARLTTCAEIYRHRQDLAHLPRWRCDACGNHVGCHHKTPDRTRPLGVIPDPAMAQARQHIHALLDPLWQHGRLKRSTVYARLTGVLGRQYHTADLRSLDEARAIYIAVQNIAREVHTQ
ncbi:MAG: zinc-finger-containing protein [Janthinobacterium lividum]